MDAKDGFCVDVEVGFTLDATAVGTDEGRSVGMISAGGGVGTCVPKELRTQ